MGAAKISRSAHLVLSAVMAGRCSSWGEFATESDELRRCAEAESVRGIDVSHHQGGSIDWKAVKRAGISFAFARVAYGTTPDTTFERNWSAMDEVGVVRGVYQYFRPSQDPIKQANAAIREIARVGGTTTGDLPIALDVEEDEGVDATSTLDAVRSWIQRVETVMGEKPIIYTSALYWSTLNAPSFRNTPLWISNFEASCPKLPGSWSDWVFWQDFIVPDFPGVGGPVDYDLFNGSLEDLQAFAVGKADFEQPRTGHCGVLRSGDILAPGTSIDSCSGEVILEQQMDGALVLRTEGGELLWTSGTAGFLGAFTEMGQGGSLLVADKTSTIWSSHTDAHPGAWLVVQDHGALTLFDSHGPFMECAGGFDECLLIRQ